MTRPAWYAGLEDRVASFGFRLAGGFHPDAGDGLTGVATLVMVGNVGPAMWRRFHAERPDGPDPLDRWTRDRLSPVAREAGADLLLPNDGPPFRPFQRWALRSEPVHRSPIGLLIHPEFGLWQAYRAALLFAERHPLPARTDVPSPCDACPQRPCLSTCPVGAFGSDGYAADRCRDHLETDAGADCMDRGCRARRACPVGRGHHHGGGQARFHMAAFTGVPNRP